MDRKGVWCVAELRHGALAPALFELLTAGRPLAEASGGPLAAVVLGGPGQAARAAAGAAMRGPDKVYLMEHEALAQFTEEAHALALKALIERDSPARVLFSSSWAGRALAARVAVLCGAALLSDVVSVSAGEGGGLEGVKPRFAGSLLSTLRARGELQLASVRPMAYEKAPETGRSAEVAPVPVDASGWKLRTSFEAHAAEESSELDLGSAERIVSGGRGLGGPQGFEGIRKLAAALGAAVGASRAAVDSGWIPYRHQVGLTGRAVRPKLYVAVGISGQIQHLAGMSSSEVIVAVNSDPEAPMMKLANLAVQGDLNELVPAVVEEIRKARG